MQRVKKHPTWFKEREENTLRETRVELQTNTTTRNAMHEKTTRKVFFVVDIVIDCLMLNAVLLDRKHVFLSGGKTQLFTQTDTAVRNVAKEQATSQFAVNENFSVCIV